MNPLWDKFHARFARWISGPKEILGPDRLLWEVDMRKWLLLVFVAVGGYFLISSGLPAFFLGGGQYSAMVLDAQGHPVELLPIFNIPTEQLVHLSPFERLGYVNPFNFSLKMSIWLAGMIGAFLHIKSRLQKS